MEGRRGLHLVYFPQRVMVINLGSILSQGLAILSTYYYWIQHRSWQILLRFSVEHLSRVMEMVAVLY